MKLFDSNKKKHDEYENIYSNNFNSEHRTNKIKRHIDRGDCLCCGGKNTMQHIETYFSCSNCGHSVDEDIYYKWLNGEAVEVETVYDESYEEVYDEDGYPVYCDYCGEEIKWKDGIYVCSNCGQSMSRSEFFNFIGAEPPGPKCIKCDNLYPGCISCPYGYLKD